MLTGTTAPGDQPHRRTAASLTEETASPVDAARELPSFAEQFVSSPRGARLARRLAVRRMEEWGYPPVSDASCTVALVVGELAANAVQHGRVPGRDFGLRLTLDAAALSRYNREPRCSPCSRLLVVAEPPPARVPEYVLRRGATKLAQRSANPSGE